MKETAASPKRAGTSSPWRSAATTGSSATCIQAFGRSTVCAMPLPARCFSTSAWAAPETERAALAMVQSEPDIFTIRDTPAERAASMTAFWSAASVSPIGESRNTVSVAREASFRLAGSEKLPSEKSTLSPQSLSASSPRRVSTLTFASFCNRRLTMRWPSLPVAPVTRMVAVMTPSLPRSLLQ
ncbi:hypothetical protein D3C87_1189350 [compost metagenome]